MISHQLTPSVLEGGPGAARFSLEPLGPFDLARQSGNFGGWPVLEREPSAIVMAFPAEGSGRAAAVVLRQPQHDLITIEAHGCPALLADQAARQALAAVSLDVDGSGWPDVGRRDRVIGGLQRTYGHLRPTLFHSAYEAAASFVIGHRISIKQARATRARLAADLGTAISIEGQRFHAFPTPAQLLAAPSLPGVNQVKSDRLHAIALAAQEGWLARAPLREMPQDDALTKLQTLPGVGPFFARGILFRGAGTVDTLTDGDEILRTAVTHAYGLPAPIDQAALEQLAERWRPYRMWAVVLLHLWGRTELGLSARRGPARRLASARARDRATTKTGG